MIESQSLSLHKMQTESNMYSNSCLNELSSNDDQIKIKLELLQTDILNSKLF